MRRLHKGPISSRVLALILLLSTIAVTAGITFLTLQNNMIREQKATIQKQKAQLERQSLLIEQSAAQLARDVSKIAPAAGNEGTAIVAAQAQAAVVQNQISSDLLPRQLIKAPVVAPAKTVLLTRGQVTGWDVDVFFCDGAKRDEDYEIARVSADIIAAASSSNRILAAGIRLGRVQLRRWPETMRDGTFKGLSVVSDGAEGEDATRNAIAKLLLDEQKTPFRLTRSIGKPTKFYTSVFACKGWIGS